MASEQHLDHSAFGPYFDENADILILGSFPSVKSREAKFFYGHPQNRFWKVISAVYDDPLPSGADIPEKKAFLTRHHIALYDVIESCTIRGSSDSTIRDVEAADLGPILAGSRIAPGRNGSTSEAGGDSATGTDDNSGGRGIFVNGGKAYELYCKYTEPVTGIPAVKLPSTSPANAAWSLDRLIAAWREAIFGAGI